MTHKIFRFAFFLSHSMLALHTHAFVDHVAGASKDGSKPD